ncbi:MAG: PorT family protein [Chitinophagaceae bacterium]|nr:PorT family protein [Chitinophagaceae bacterium]
MKKSAFFFAILLPVAAFSQQENAAKHKKSKEDNSIGIGIRGGLNFANVTNASSINSRSQTGYHAGLFLAPSSASVLGSRTEITFSRQGYNYGTGANTGSVKLDYIILSQMMAVNITKYVQIQVGAQTAYLLNAKADSVKQQSTGNATADKILGFYNRIDYGLGGGIEFHPFKGIVLGGRYTMSLANLYKTNTSTTGGASSYIPHGDLNFKNNVVQFFVGYRF